jgi:hypothetical protein
MYLVKGLVFSGDSVDDAYVVPCSSTISKGVVMRSFDVANQFAKLVRVGLVSCSMVFATVAYASMCSSEMMPCSSDDVLVSTAVSSVSGPINSQTIVATLTIKSEHQHERGSIYVAAIVSGQAYFLSANGSWAAFTTGITPGAYATGELPASLVIPIVKDADLGGMQGAQIVIGYGISGLIATPGYAFNKMINAANYWVAYTVPKQ